MCPARSGAGIGSLRPGIVEALEEVVKADGCVPSTVGVAGARTFISADAPVRWAPGTADVPTVVNPSRAATPATSSGRIELIGISS